MQSSNRQPHPAPPPSKAPGNRQPRPLKTPPGLTNQRGVGQGAFSCCDWCGQPLPHPDPKRGGQRRRFCTPSCRTLAHREKSRQIAGVFAAVMESPVSEAERYIEAAGMSRATALLNVAGVSWRPDRRAFLDRTGRAVRLLE